jgi:hypothetical protein
VKIGADGCFIIDVSNIKKIGTGGKSRAGGDDKQAFLGNGLMYGRGLIAWNFWF